MRSYQNPSYNPSKVEDEDDLFSPDTENDIEEGIPLTSTQPQPYSSARHSYQPRYSSSHNQLASSRDNLNWLGWFQSSDKETSLRRRSVGLSSSQHALHSESCKNPSNTAYPRVIGRSGGMFNQSLGTTYIQKKMNTFERCVLYYKMDWFHSLIDAPTSRILLIVLGCYVVLVFIFALIYFALYKMYGCALNLDNFTDAFIFSLETFATIGFSAPGDSIFFDQCKSVITVLTLQSCLRLVVEAITIGVLYSRLARPASRASTIIFSDRAVLRRIRGRLYFMFQLCELRKHQLVEAHIRLYVIKHEVDPSTHFANLSYPSYPPHHNEAADPATIDLEQQPPSLLPPVVQTHPAIFIQSCYMRLNHPNDELGAMLLLMLPQVVVHELDITSPLMPPPLWISAATGEVIRWNPPVYRSLRKRKPEGLVVSQQHSPLGEGDEQSLHSQRVSTKRGGAIETEDTEGGQRVEEDLLDTYDAEAVSNIQFPAVQRRGVEIYANSPLASPPLLSHSTSATVLPFRSPPPSSHGTGDPRLITPPRNQKKPLSDQEQPQQQPQQQPPQPSLSQSQKSSGKPSSLLVETLKTKGRTPPRTHLTPVGGAESAVLSTCGLESPGLKKYNSDLNIASYYAQYSQPSTPSQLRTYSSENDLLAANKIKKHTTPLAVSTVAPAATASGAGNAIKQLPQPKPQRFYHLKGDNANEISTSVAGSTRMPPPGGQQLPSRRFFSPELGSEDGDGDGQDPRLRRKPDGYQPLWQIQERDMIDRYLLDRKIEIIAIVEGVDATTGGQLQARHSYTYSDIEWDKTFENCIFPSNLPESVDQEIPSNKKSEGNIVVDFEYFHELRDAPKDAAYPGLIASYI